MTEDIAIVGMAGRFPGADDVSEYWSNILAGRVTVTELDSRLDDPAYVPARGVLDGADEFDAEFFGITPAEAAIMDPQHRLLLETAWTTLESAGLAGSAPFGRVGVFAGAGYNYYLHNHVLARPDVLDTHGLLSIVLGNEKDHLAARIAYRLQLGGPAITVQTACSTSLVAVHLACQSLRTGDSDVALAGGVCVALPQRSGYRYEPKGILSPDGVCRPFDATANGTVPGNGVAMVALKRAGDARRAGDPIYALIRGSAVNNDGGAKVGYTAPGVAGQIDVLSRAYAGAGVDPATVGYVEAHGTATEVGDAIELAALTEVFGGAAGPCSLGSVKANVGHLDAAAGVAGLIKAALALSDKRIPPLAGLKQPRPELLGGPTPFRLDGTARDWPAPANGPRRAAVSSFGLGGTNVHVVLEEEVPVQVPAGDGPAEALLPVSARTPEALRAAADRLARHLRERPGLSVHDVALTLQSHRRHFPHRLSVCATDVPDAVARLGRARGRATVRRPSTVFLFPGQGAEFAAMAAEPYRRYPSFRADIDLGAGHLREPLGFDVRDVLLRDESGGLIHRTDVTQPALVLYEYALGRLLLGWGVHPTVLIGHSVGELAAAGLAGELDLADMLRLVAVRGALMQDAPEGGMVAVLAGPAELGGFLAGLDELDIAAVNGPDSVVVAGPVAPLERLRDRLTDAGVTHRTLPATRAFHSRMMAGAAEALDRAAAAITPRPRDYDVISSVDGAVLPRGRARAAGYWAEALRRPVRFHDAVRTALDRPNPVLVEVGPGTALTGLVRPAGDHPVVALQPRRGGDRGILAGAGALWAAGVDLDWPAVRAGAGVRGAGLPGYPFAGTRHWLDAGPAPAEPEAARPAPAGGALATVIELWQTMLGSAEITADTSFFAIGGESLTFLRMISRVQRRFGVALSVAELTETATPRAIADQVEAHRCAS
ncbi:MAG TPA: beta-ketoacyl synthase N-terminal-like domain-containing protein [Actinophytocola sp.]|uniref:type I polyketide synthase n=1 Tax=Actinophytocola sp. TaxID=1872138 RepID=UPI002DB8E771|nr:beta-ketoacyl synthase N-terminal-like domain-containing protein [Actinophytocola sp.]HEU5473424.1 beta-ketoacyl synthase N-terminal-like domain-containing protein [Actinophytocola sp.]